MISPIIIILILSTLFGTMYIIYRNMKTENYNDINKIKN